MKNLILFLGSMLFPVLGFAQQMEITVLTYNIYHGERPEEAGKTNLEEVAQLILELNPDVVALQEIDSMTLRSVGIFGQKTNLVAELAKMTGYTGFFAKAMDYGEGGYGEALLVKGDAEFERQLLSTPVGGEPRSAAWTKLNLKNGSEILVGGTHLCHQFEENRSAQVKELIRFSQEAKLPHILMGDFNFTPESAPYQIIPKSWIDAAHKFNPNQPTYGSPEEGKRIDYIFASQRDFEVIEYQVIDVPFSDHYPVRAKIRLKTP
ncbi:endonuclease/exonuclease/phosphatase family protein [Algoriphagus hitonicola]|uniref:Metal-dependent hydrolase, endonuclease/exonuclease/phosphatase family n=1 Tax=Algoriphagus hitonicola TaxID=435880 RepID=A0A1I2TJY4_9BACT|nr:endonuclease/exonuclease/phosphatase family protein [Algoriphagus hitonicola]SFG65222.1 Metal-dependent hydrolase, endonuclease/exonuclease/phosphatase family [Algoriphagus hitonicola]